MGGYIPLLKFLIPNNTFVKMQGLRLAIWSVWWWKVEFQQLENWSCWFITTV